MSAVNPLLTDIESMKHMLMAAACGGDRADPGYPVLRLKLIKTPIRERLPRFIHTCRDLGEFWAFIQPKFGTYAERRAYLIEEFAPLLDELERADLQPGHDPIQKTLAKVDSAHVQEVWKKALDRRQDDPEGAITAARTLLETICKHILDACAVPYDDKADLPKLHALTIEQLNLAPSQHTEPLFRTILGSCQSVVNSLGALRNQLGDAHGRSPRQVKPAPRHAELAVNLAGTMAAFLVATWEIKEPLVSQCKGLTPEQDEILRLAKTHGGSVSLYRTVVGGGNGFEIEGLPDIDNAGTHIQVLIDRGILGVGSNGKVLNFPLTELGIAIATELSRYCPK